MSAIVSQITVRLTICSTACHDWEQKKHPHVLLGNEIICNTDIAFWNDYYSGTTWATWCFKSPADRLLIIETRFENSSVRRSKLGGVSYIGGFGDRNMKYKVWHRSLLTESDNRWSCGRAIFQGNPASKTNKTSSPFHNNIVLEILDH